MRIALNQRNQNAWSLRHSDNIMEEIVGNSVLILGYGREGKSVYRYLRRRYPKLKIAIADKNPITPPEDKNVVLYTGKDYLDKIGQFDTIVRSPGVPAKLEPLQQCIQEGKHITSATNIFFSQISNFTVGITGTKGKSTTASLLEKIAKKKFRDSQLIGNIGKPVLDYLPKAKKRTFFIIELSSHQLEGCRYSPNISVVLNIYPEHLRHFNDIYHYTEAKSNIVKYQTKEDTIITNPNYSLPMKLIRNSPAKRFYFAKGFAKEIFCFSKRGYIMAVPFRKPIVSIKDIPLKGEHNLENVLAATTTGIILGVRPESIAEAIRTFKPLPHRLEFVAEIQGIKFFNDSLATIPEATISALKALGSRVETLIAGGYDRGLDLEPLAKYLSSSKVRTLILFPETGERLLQAISEKDARKGRFRKYQVTSMNEAVDIAFQETSKGKICLLSPAAASFNLFRDYADRGNQFKRSVRRHANKTHMQCGQAAHISCVSV